MGHTSLLNAEVVAFAYDETGDAKYRDFWLDMMQGVLASPPGGNGKGFTQATRQTVYGLERAREWGVTDLPK